MFHEYCLFVLSVLCLNSRTSDSFKWTRVQQSTRIINAQLGVDVSLPCDFLLSAEEESAMQQYHLIYWTREMPIGSQSWQGLAVRTNLVGNSEAQIIYHDKSRILMKNNSFTILEVKHEDEGQYQCEVKSSFYTTPSVMKLNVLTERSSTSKLSSTMSSGASAGLSVGLTLLIIGVIILGGMAWKARKKRKTTSEASTNLGYISSPTNNADNAAEAYFGPASYCGSEMNPATNNEYFSGPINLEKPKETSSC